VTDRQASYRSTIVQSGVAADCIIHALNSFILTAVLRLIRTIFVRHQRHRQSQKRWLLLLLMMMMMMMVMVNHCTPTEVLIIIYVDVLMKFFQRFLVFYNFHSFAGIFTCKTILHVYLCLEIHLLTY